MKWAGKIDLKMMKELGIEVKPKSAMNQTEIW